MVVRRGIFMCIVACMLVVGAACNADSNSGDGAEVNSNNEQNDQLDQNNEDVEQNMSEPDPVTVTIGTGWWRERLEEKIPLIEAEFPHITIELIDTAGRPTDDEFEEMIVAQQIPDIFSALEQRPDFTAAYEYDLLYDFEYILEAKNVDVGMYDSGIMDSFRNASPIGGVVALPFASNYYALHYNKDIFDRFGVDYPQDNMTWDEVMNLAGQVTREEDGTQYRGISFNKYLASFMLSQFGENFIDPDSGEVNILESEGHRQIIEMLDRFASIPGNVPDEQTDDWIGDFEQGILAMEVNWHRMWALEPDNEALDGVNWDIVTFPTWEGREGIGPEPNAASWMLSKTAEDKEAAVDVILYLTSAEEVRLPQIRNGEPPALAHRDIQDQFGAELPGIENYNTEALYKLTPSGGAPEISEYENHAPPLLEFFDEYVQNHHQYDVQEFMRYMQEVTEDAIEEYKGTR